MGRCSWAKNDWLGPYHDTEWGVPVHDDRLLFESLILDGMQAGLNWLIILKKRAAYRLALDGFDPHKVAAYGEEKVAELLANPGIIRNRAKITAAINNAQAFLRVQEESGSFDAYLWGFVDGRAVKNAWGTVEEIPARTPLSDRISKDLVQRGFKFAGSTICYAILQSVGLVNDHTVDCFRYEEVSRLK
ncbi:MAG: DNA-3-methyladenine glycosylase I [Chloroflexi bacterium]|nr:DNA-3-methyladenine glycosylase I [Chloroflexota bacterium]